MNFNWLGIVRNGPSRLIPHWSNGHGDVIGLCSIDGCLLMVVVGCLQTVGIYHSSVLVVMCLASFSASSNLIVLP